MTPAFEPQAQAQLARFADRICAGLGANLIGVYVHGSLAMGYFNPRHSDLDLLLLNREPPTPAALAAAASAVLASSGAPYPFEISLLNAQDLQPWRHPAPYDWHFGEDSRPQATEALARGTLRAAVDTRDADLAAHVTVTRARGVALLGPPPGEVFPAVPAQDFRDSLLQDFAWGRRGLAQNPVYFVLNACRVLAFLRTGQVLSKAEGGRWALEHLERLPASIIRQALVQYATTLAPADFDATQLEGFAREAERLLLTGHSARLPDDANQTGPT
jgi:streptomycin 3"-adenylyltransferase